MARHRAEEGPPESGRGIGGTWSRGPLAGCDRVVDQERVVQMPIPCASSGSDPQRSIGAPLPPLDAPRSFFRGSDLEGGRGRRAIPLRLISGRIPNLKLGPLLHLDSRPSGDAPRARSLAEWCGKGRARLRPRFLNGALVRLLPQTSLRRTGRSRTPETRIGPDTTRSRPVPRSHPRNRGPCSTFRRSLFHFPAVPAPRSGASPILAATPCGLARVLAHGFVASPLLSRSKRRTLLRALSQDRASASRVLPC